MCDWRPFVAGVAAGVANVVAGHPLDTLKVRRQTAALRAGGAAMRQGSVLAGIVAPLLTVPWLGGLNFGIYDAARLRLSGGWPAVFARRPAGGQPLAMAAGVAQVKSNILCIFTSGVFSGWVVCNITCPTNNVKVQQQTLGAGRRLGLAEAGRRRGVRGLFKGYFPHAITESVGRGLYMMNYELAKEVLGLADSPSSRGDGNSVELPGRIFCGAVGGSSAWLMIYPADVVRNRLMGDWRREVYSGTMDCIRKTYREEGVAGFYRGAGYTLLRAVPVAAMTLTTYDFALDSLR